MRVRSPLSSPAALIISIAMRWRTGRLAKVIGQHSQQCGQYEKLGYVYLGLPLPPIGLRGQTEFGAI